MVKFKGDQYYSRTIRKLEIEELPAILNPDQNEVPDEANKENEIWFNVALQSNTRRLVKNFSIHLLGFVIIVKNLRKNATL